MKTKEIKLARKLRKQGWSMNDIQKELSVSKSSVSRWVKDIRLSKKQRKKLNKKGFSKEAIEKRRETRLRNEKAKRQVIIDKAKSNIRTLSKKDLKIIGIALYWGEGSKTQRGSVRIFNSDPKIITLSMIFFRKICEVSEDRFRGRLYIHSHLKKRQAEKFWSDLTKIPLSQFHKTHVKKSIASKNKRDTIPLGTFEIYIGDTSLFLKIKGWIEKIYELGIK
ncbi:MAG: helix-turn-helix domain-containing protein [Candidatus Portnoybacteria bacterium]|nr:helix-turn-helix domain-containing protein [Candidatus Portnoybacteria bacterium]